MKYTFVQTHTSDNLILSGLLSETENKGIVILHIHGYEGDFYTNKFVHNIAESLTNINVSFLTVQHRGTGSETEIYKHPYGSGGSVYGSHYEKLEDAHLDISAWIRYLKSIGYNKIILEGHSLGTYKIMRYLSEGEYKNDVTKVILLAPFDKNYEIKLSFEKTDFYSSGKTLEEMLYIVNAEIQKGNGRKLVPFIIDSDTRSFENLYSWASSDDLGNMFDFSRINSYNFQVFSGTNIPVCIIVGSDDDSFHPSNPSNPQEVLQKLKKTNKLIETHLVDGSEHGFEGYEREVSSIVNKFSKDTN